MGGPSAGLAFTLAILDRMTPGRLLGDQRVAVTGTIEAKAPHVSKLEVKLTNARIDPVMRALGSRFENAVVITASANAHVQGPLLEPDRMTAQVRDGHLCIAVPEYALDTAPGAVIDVEKREIRIAGLTLTG